MSRTWLIAAIGGLSLGVAACGDYDEKGYDQNNAAYDEGNTAYDAAGNEAYDAGGNAAYDAPEGNGAYAPPPDANASYNNLTGDVPPENTVTNRY